MKVEFNKKYQSGLIANTDLHAGGLFFCIIYRYCLNFFENGKVELTKKLVDAFRPMDGNDVKGVTFNLFLLIFIHKYQLKVTRFGYKYTKGIKIYNQ